MSAPAVFPAIVLKSYETGNTSEVLHVVCGELGRYSVYARGLNSPKSRFRGVLQPLSLVELTLAHREGSEMSTLRDATLLHNNAELTGDFERLSLALVLAESAANSCEVAHEAHEIFDALLEALTFLDPRTGDPAPNAACRGLIGLLQASGHGILIDEELLRPWPAGKPKPVCFWIDTDNATIHARGAQPSEAPHWPQRIPERPTRIAIPPTAVRTIHNLQRNVPQPQPLDGPEATQLFQALIALIEYHSEYLLRSAKFWRDVFIPK